MCYQRPDVRLMVRLTKIVYRWWECRRALAVIRMVFPYGSVTTSCPRSTEDNLGPQHTWHLITQYTQEILWSVKTEIIISKLISRANLHPPSPPKQNPLSPGRFKTTSYVLSDIHSTWDWCTVEISWFDVGEEIMIATSNNFLLDRWHYIVKS